MFWIFIYIRKTYKKLLAKLFFRCKTLRRLEENNGVQIEITKSQGSILQFSKL